jgi:hypothetical protein
MKLQSLSEHMLTNQDMNSTKGGKRMDCVLRPRTLVVFSKPIKPLVTYVVSPPKVPQNIRIDWNCPKKP